MDIHHFSTHTTFGAAIAARRLHHSLLEKGVSSTFLYRYNNGCVDHPSYLQFSSRKSRGPGGRILNRLVRSYFQLQRHHRPPGLDPFRLTRLDDVTPYCFNRSDSTIIHLHFIADMLDYHSFFLSLPKNQPIVWTLHDMNPITGGCHYAWGCEKFKSSCGSCPQLNVTRNPLDISRINVLWRSLALKGCSLHLVANSRWLEQQARESFVFNYASSLQTVHCGVDVEGFRPLNRAACRDKLGIAHDAQVICFGAESIADPRKGMRELLIALEQIDAQRSVTLLSFGSGSLPPGSLPFEHRQLGRLDSATELAEAYSASDLFVIPSLHEAFGQTSLEAMSCGIPVVGFAVGGIPDMVKPGRTGLLAAPGDAADLGAAIRQLLHDDTKRLESGRCAREMAVTDFSLEMQLKKYLRLYGELLARG